MNAQLTRADIYKAIEASESEGIETSELCERFSEFERQRVHGVIAKLVKENPPRVMRAGPGRVVAACYHASNAGCIQAGPVRKQGIVVGSVMHRMLLALRAPGGMTTEQIYERFRSPTGEIASLRSAGLITCDGNQVKQVNLTEKGRELVHPDGPLARRRTLNTYCQL